MSDGGELRVERSLWRIVREAEIGREEREGLREKRGIQYTVQREGEKGDKINERREKNNNKLIFSYNILVRTKCFGT